MKLLKSTLLLSMALLSGQAAALEFGQVQASESTLAFGYTQMGVPLGNYRAQLRK